VNVQRFLTQTVLLERRLTQDSYAGNTYAAPVKVAARWLTSTHLVRGRDGGEVVSDTYLSTLAPISEGDRVTDEAGRAREVVRVRINRGTRGTMSHYVAYLA